MFINLIVIIASFLIGSFPTAHILFVKFVGKDIRTEGTGNVGAMNAYEVSGKKWIGIATFLIDALKGIAAVYLATLLSSRDLYSLSLALVFVILGHNYSPFIGFKGGRGLATAFGGVMLINPLIAILWILLFFPAYKIFNKDIISGNIASSILSPILFIQTPDIILNIFNTAHTNDFFDLKKLCFMINFIILLKYKDTIISFVKNITQNK